MWIITAWKCVAPEVIVKGLKMFCISSALECYETAMKRMIMLGESVRKMKALTVKMETVTLIGRGR
jgi:hypothetical protein